MVQEASVMQSIIITGIIVLFVTIIALFAKAVCYFVPKARRAVLFTDFGVRPFKTKTTGFHFNFRWPWVLIKDEITTEVLTMNMPSFVVNVRSDANNQNFAALPDAGIDLFTGEESLYYVIDLSVPSGQTEEEKLRDYYNLLSPNITWVAARERIEGDYIKDPFQTLFREKIEKLPLTEARLAKSKIMKQIQIELQKYFDEKNYPFIIRSITANAPLNFVNKDEEKTYFAPSKAKLEKTATIFLQETARVKAELQIEISQLQGRGKAVELTTLLESIASACGITASALGPHKFAETMLLLRNLEITQKLYENQSGKFVINAGAMESLIGKIFEMKNFIIQKG